MAQGFFDEPVSIFVGLSFTRPIRNVAEAYATLAEWPRHQRNSAHAVALAACRHALQDGMPAEEARRAFTEFLHGVDRLAPAGKAQPAPAMELPA